MMKNKETNDISPAAKAVASPKAHSSPSVRGVGAALRELRHSTSPSDGRGDPLLAKSTALTNAEMERSHAADHSDSLPDLDNSGVPGAYSVEGAGGPVLESAPQSDLSSESANTPAPASATIEGAMLVDRNDEADPEQGQGNTPGEVIEGTLMEEKQSKRMPPLLLILLLLGVLLVAFIPTVVFGLLPSSSETVNPDISLSEEPPVEDETTLYPPFTTELAEDTLTRIQVFNSSFYKANLWTRNDPNLDTYSLERQVQRFRMVVFFHENGGRGWFRNDNWLSYQVGECSWFSHNSSVSIGGWHPGMEPEPMCDEKGGLKLLNLTRNNLQSINPVHQTGLGPLRILDLSHNRIKGNMATFGAFAKDMQVLDISHNLLAGQMKGGGGMQPVPVRIFGIGGNQLVGLSPMVCMLMPHLEVLSVAGNPMGTELTAAYTGCHNTTHFLVANTALQGQIPSEFSTLHGLRELNVSSNPKITGTIPTELSLLPNLTVLDISKTAITGTIPEPLCAKSRDGTLEITANCSMVQCCY